MISSSVVTSVNALSTPYKPEKFTFKSGDGETYKGRKK